MARIQVYFYFLIHAALVSYFGFYWKLVYAEEIANINVDIHNTQRKYFLDDKVYSNKVLTCFNQTLCIQPKLILQKHYNIYYCNHMGHGIRLYYLIKEGLLLHPKISFVNNPHTADVIVYLPHSMDWDASESSNPIFRNKLLIFDEGDYPNLFFKPPEVNDMLEFALYFKRSYAVRNDGSFDGFTSYLHNDNVFPMTYTIMEAYVRTKFNRYKDRNIEVMCTLRERTILNSFDSTRARILEYMKEYVVSRQLSNFIIGEVNHLSRAVVSTDYFNDMYNAKIIVTANPSGWEGDFRLMEAFATGALIFVDKMYVPRPHPLIHGTHVIYYDNNNKTE